MVFKNKRDERSIVVKNKVRLVAQGFRQEEGIDYDEVFAPVSRIEAIRLFLAFASYMGFTVYQMDVKSAFLYGTIEEEVYVHQPPGFVDPAYPNKVYKVIKALYGLHQAPRAWYETLSSFLMENGFKRGTIDKTLFIKKKKCNIMLVQVYVDDIIFGSTKKSMCTEFEECMHKRFQMISWVNSHSFWDFKTATTPIESNKPLVKDEDGVDVDVHVYRFQVTPKASHLNAVKRIFSDNGGAEPDRKTTTGDVNSWKKIDSLLKVSTDRQSLYRYKGSYRNTEGAKGKVTPLFDSMLVQQTEDEGDASERPSDSPPIPSPPHPSEDQPQIQPDLSPRPSPTTHIPDSIPRSVGIMDSQLSKEIKALKAQVKKLKKGVKPLITHHKAWMKTRLEKKTSLKKKGVHKEYVSKQGRKSVKSFKGEPFVHKDPAFDDLDDFVDVDDTLDYMESEDAQDEGRTSSVVLEEKESANEGVSTKAPVSTDKQNEGTDKQNEGTDKQDGSTDSTTVSTDRQGEGTADQDEGKSVTQTPTSTPTLITPTPTIFGDDETIAQVLIIMSQNKEKLKEKEKGVEIRNVEETKRPRPTSTRSILTLRPLPKIDPKDKGKKRLTRR
ncbi:putative ribonuclease H-like domain-containing protein [Tanacetum coccineum]